jgi:hypothetical protein
VTHTERRIVLAYARCRRRAGNFHIDAFNDRSVGHVLVAHSKLGNGTVFIRSHPVELSFSETGRLIADIWPTSVLEEAASWLEHVEREMYLINFKILERAAT